MRKKIRRITIAAIILLPVLIYITIVIANNCIADNIEKELKAIELPENTELIDSISIAGKMTGNGNGMQYYGAILVSSDMSIEELEAYYKSFSDEIWVEKQDSSKIFEYHHHKFNDFDPGKNNYRVYMWKYNEGRYTGENALLSELLDCDLRGH